MTEISSLEKGFKISSSIAIIVIISILLYYIDSSSAYQNIQNVSKLGIFTSISSIVVSLAYFLTDLFPSNPPNSPRVQPRLSIISLVMLSFSIYLAIFFSKANNSAYSYSSCQVTLTRWVLIVLLLIQILYVVSIFVGFNKSFRLF